MKDYRVRKQTRFNTAMIVVVSGLYLLFSVGIVKATHFCMGTEASVTFFSGDASECGCKLVASEKDGCCEDEHELLRIDDSQKNMSQFQLSLPVLSVLAVIHPLTGVPAHGYVASIDEWQAPRPPLALYKVYCTYVFYDDDWSRA